MRIFKLKQGLCFLLLMAVGALPIHSTQAETIEWVEAPVKFVSVKYGNGCIRLDLNPFVMVRLDLTTDAGKAELALALSAQTTGGTLKVRQLPDQPLVGNCDVGVVIKAHDQIIWLAP